jgi:hypothetical protein
MPYLNEHACRLRDPGDFAPGSFRSMRRLHGSQPYRVIVGKLRGTSGPRDPMVEQTYRYPTDAWTEDEARAHCREHGGGLFEPAARRARRD